MLERTFIHIPGIGPTTEQLLWRQGIRTWAHADRLEPASRVVRARACSLLRQYLPGSRRALQERDAGFFGRLSTLGEAWRAYRHFARDAVYLDIETTGLSVSYDQITIVGVSDGQSFRCFRAGADLEALPDYLRRFRVILTFNGAGFDLRFLRAAFPGLELPPLHIDLRRVTHRLGMTGGLKAIERSLGLQRDAAVADLDGFEAVRLWRRYQRGDRGALDLLVQYNSEDVLHLREIMETSYAALQSRLLAPFAA